MSRSEIKMMVFRFEIVTYFLIVLLGLEGACHAQNSQSETKTGGFEKKVDIGGRSLFISCTPQIEGKPTVVFEAGMNEASATWDKVRPEVEKFARVCVYDRAGLGKSDPSGRQTATAENIVNDLNLLLTKGKVSGPYVLVGHSFGGLTVRLFAAKHSSMVTGLVLVDAVHEQETEKWLKIIPPEIRRQMEAGGAMMARGGESLDLRESDRQMKSANWRTDVPLIVIARGKASFSAETFPPALREFAPRGESLRIQMQKELSQRSPRGKLVFAEKSGHFVQNDEPQIVVDAIKEVIVSIK